MASNNIISKEWQQVLEYYNKLSTQEEKDQFLHGLSGEQKEFLLGNLEWESITAIQKVEEPTKKSPLSTIKSFFKKDSSDNYKRGDKVNLTLLLTGSTVFGLLSFIITGLIFNYANTIFFIRQIPVFGSVLGVESEQTREAYYGNYDNWLKRNEYSFDKYEDEDKDGILNIDEFIIGTDAINEDENGNSVTDGQDFLSGFNPATGTLLDSTDPIFYDKLQVIDSNEQIHNRLVSYSWKGHTEFLSEKDLIRGEFPESYGIIDPNSIVTDEYEIDLSKPVLLTVDKIGLFKQDITFQKDNSDIEGLLAENSATHLYSSPLPGERGDSIIALPNLGTEPTTLRSASSKLNTLNPNNQIVITMETKSNKKITLNYDIIKNNVYDSDNINYSKQLSNSQIVLTSSWPEDSYEKRVFVVGKLTNMIVEDSVSQL